jgi:hypothetical protein
MELKRERLHEPDLALSVATSTTKAASTITGKIMAINS